MPTMPKLIAGVLIAILGYVAAEAFKPGMPEGSYFGQFSLICAVIGFLVGWIVLGNKVGLGFAGAVSAGLQAAVVFTFFALLGFSIYLMLKRSARMMYDDPMQALVGVFDMMMKHGALLFTAQVMGVLVIGGIIAGLAVDWVGKRAT